jgi:tetratricopeptide (TPR) repeat protein
VRRWLVACLLAGTAWAADPPGTPGSQAALARCKAADRSPEAERDAVLADALAMADRAIAADERDPIAHFAAFCAVGGLMAREGLSLSAPGNLRRLRREVDRTLDLAPDFPDALTGKGALLVNLPRLLGGDPAEGERLLRRALAVDPDYVRPRLTLVQALRARGALDDARAEAAQALAIAERTGDPEDARQARAHLDALGAGRPNP